MNNLKEFLTNIDVMQRFTFDEFLIIITDVYEQKQEKRNMIINYLTELSKMKKISRTDVMIRAMHVSGRDIGKKHFKIFQRYQNVKQLHSIILNDPFQTIKNHVKKHNFENQPLCSIQTQA